MRFPLLTVAAMLVAFGPQRGMAAHQGEEESGYVKVEIRGKLEVSGTVATDWKTALEKDSTGVTVTVPGQRVLTVPGDNVMANRYRGERLPGFRWQLFLGKKKKLLAQAERLKGKTVVVKGTMKVIRWPRHPVLGQWSPSFAVQVAHLEAGEGKK